VGARKTPLTLDNRGVSVAFPSSANGVAGYDPVAVDSFLDEARRVYEASEGTLTSSDIRKVVFPLVNKGGYETEAVDQALWRLEEAFAKRERDTRTDDVGEADYYQSVRDQAQEILDRIARPSKAKFRRAKIVQYGYHPADVDHFCQRLVAYFQGQDPLSVATVRNQKFRTILAGYDEKQVDQVLDETVAVMLAVR
jgi:DivIVA domain-containing protein